MLVGREKGKVTDWLMKTSLALRSSVLIIDAGREEAFAEGESEASGGEAGCSFGGTGGA